MPPALVSFDVFGTLIDVRAGSRDAFRRILAEAGGDQVDVQEFWESWEAANIAGYLGPYRPYREIARASLATAFARHGLRGDPGLIAHYFAAFPGFRLFDDVVPTLDVLARHCRLAVVSNIDDDLLAATPLPDVFALRCTAEAARGYKPDGTLFRHLLAAAGVPMAEILHCGQSQHTDMVGAKPLGLTVWWINRRRVALAAGVPAPDRELTDIAGLLPALGLEGDAR